MVSSTRACLRPCLLEEKSTASINNYASFCMALCSLCCFHCAFESIISSHRMLWEMEGVGGGARKLASLGAEHSLSLCFSRSGALQGGWCYSKWAPTSHLVRLCSRGQCLPVSRLPLEPPTCLSTLLVRMPYFQPGSSFLFLLKAWLDFATGSAEVWVLSRACG